MGGLAASTFRWGCRFALSAPPFGLRTANRQPQRKPRQNTKNPSKEQKPKRPQERKNRKETLRIIYNLGGAKADDRKGPTGLTKPKEVYYNFMCPEVAAEALRAGAWSPKSGREVCACGRMFFPSYDPRPAKVV